MSRCFRMLYPRNIAKLSDLSSLLKLAGRYDFQDKLATIHYSIGNMFND